jgi:sugar phosphate isomerase/epimerase
MKLGAMTFSFEPGTLHDIVQRIRAMGLDTIDLDVRTPPLDKTSCARRPREQAALVRRILSEHEMEVSEIFVLHCGDPINHPDPAKRAASRELFAGMATFCREVGAGSIMMSPGPLHEAIGHDASVELAVSELRLMQEVCARNGLQLSIEPHWHSLAESPDMARYFCEQVSGLRLTLCYAHFIAQGYAQSEIEPLHAYTHHMHARQAKMGFTNVPKHEGIIDYARIIRGLASAGWDGVICLEYNPKLIANAVGEMEWLKGVLNGYFDSGDATSPVRPSL